MASFSVAEAKNNLSALIERALRGEHVVITRYGHDVVELRATAPSVSPEISHDEIRAHRNTRPAVPVSSLDILNAMYDEQ